MNSVTSPMQPPLQKSQSGQALDFTGRRSNKTPSVPTSPIRDKRSSFLGRVSNLSQIVTAAVSSGPAASYNPDRHLTLLVIDDEDTVWSSYFQGKQVFGDWDIRVEQAQFQDLTVRATSQGGVTVSIKEDRVGARSSRTFKPDFLLIRQNLKNATEDYKNVLLGFQYGGVPSINSLQSIYNFQDKPWVFAHLMDIQRRVGNENFPLIEQTYYPDHKDMDQACQFPCIFKVGHAHGGLGKVKVESETAYQDLASVVAVSGQYVTVEQYVEAKYDLHIFKIGDFYRAMICTHCCDCRRKSVSGNWKTNLEQSVLEEVPVDEKYKQWIDQVSSMFGGLALCSLEAVVGKDGKEYIIEVNDCAMGLLGDSQEEDKRKIAEMVIKEMEVKCKVPGNQEVLEDVRKIHEVEDRMEGGEMENGRGRNICRTDSIDSSVSSSSAMSETSTTSSHAKKDTQKETECPNLEINGNEKNGNVVEGEDTMKNLRSSFAGLFGDLK